VNRYLRLALSVGALTLTACAWWVAGRPTLLDRLTFSHKRHIDMDFPCDACHGEVAAASDMAKAYLPVETNCMDCHDREDKCPTCHPDADRHRARAVVPSALHFSHKNHLERTKDGCTLCHAGAIASVALPPGRPHMDVCLSCHNHLEDYAESRCAKCHLDMPHAPRAAVAELDHGGDWIGRHGMFARTKDATCMQCHAATRCTPCHSSLSPAAPAALYPEEVGRTLWHHGDWIAAHPIEARADGDTCYRCHSTASCQGCHAAWNVAPGSADANTPHPAGWLRRGSDTFHGDEARLHIESCAACHGEGQSASCVTCHSVGRVGGNPHPPGWASRYNLEDAAGIKPCRTCHATR